ncbi:hypothetical protein M2S00_06580 [Apilactobacillus sp. TMW 2.2459]|uniref:hypothetical protein n=1 Tax=Apilactobacillus xinyiensis TaxID=2841032 RepID=UPI00200E91CB|nr:hypothetical protein [Apilactobacillus xinyiensis]MCL0312769.1 hypothetical protein [Apilactobacillus xinyiensis]
MYNNLVPHEMELIQILRSILLIALLILVHFSMTGWTQFLAIFMILIIAIINVKEHKK